MADYSISFARSARKELESLPAKLVQRIFPTIEALAKEPRPIFVTGKRNAIRFAKRSKRELIREALEIGCLRVAEPANRRDSFPTACRGRRLRVSCAAGDRTAYHRFQLQPYP